MKILYLLKRDPDETLRRVMEVHKRNHDVVVVDVRSTWGYGRLVSHIAEADKVISW